MFEFLFGNPVKKLKKLHAKLMGQAVDAQRNGNMALFAELSTKADKVYDQMLKLEKEQAERAH